MLHCKTPIRSVAVALWLLLEMSVIVAPQVMSVNDPGDFLVRSTARLAVAFWAVAAVLMIHRYSGARLIWSLACAAYLIHVATAFEYAHHWSHAAAFQHVKDSSGVGEGIFVSYFFTALWTFDACWRWLSRCSYEARPCWLGWAIHGFMVFIIVNGTVIYEDGVIRWVSAVVLTSLTILLVRSRQQANQAKCHPTKAI